MAAQHGQMEFAREMLNKVSVTVRSDQPKVPSDSVRDLHVEVTISASDTSNIYIHMHVYVRVNVCVAVYCVDSRLFLVKHLYFYYVRV